MILMVVDEVVALENRVDIDYHKDDWLTLMNDHMNQEMVLRMHEEQMG